MSPPAATLAGNPQPVFYPRVGETAVTMVRGCFAPIPSNEPINDAGLFGDWLIADREVHSAGDVPSIAITKTNFGNVVMRRIVDIQSQNLIFIVE